MFIKTRVCRPSDVLCFHYLLVLCSVFVLLSGCAAPDNRPNIIFILTDDHAATAFSAYDSTLLHTPNLDRLATGGMRFEKSFCTNSICAPSRAAILTGVYSHINGQESNLTRFDSSQVTFPALLQQSGYQTALVGKWHLRSDPVGFDFWKIIAGQGQYYNPDFLTNGADKPERISGYTTDIITGMALDWLKKRRRNQPFCLLLHHKAPHRNWMPGPKQLALFADRDLPLPSGFAFRDSSRQALSMQEQSIARHMYPAYDLKLPLSLNRHPDSLARDSSFWMPRYQRMTSEQRQLWDAAYEPQNRRDMQRLQAGENRAAIFYQRYIKDYLRCVASVDENIGTVLDYLRSSGLEENTIVIYTSDQGFFLGEMGLYDKRFIYEPSLRSPLVVRYPQEVPAGTVDARHMVLNIDLMPTLLDYAGVNPPARLQGASLRGILGGSAGGEDPAWRQGIYYRYSEFPAEHAVRRHYGIRTGRYKLIHFYHDIDQWELFDLRQDPLEQHNLINLPQMSSLSDSLRGELERLQKELGDTLFSLDGVAAAP